MRLFVRSLLITILGITLSSVNAFSQTATIKTDQLDYPPGSTVIITGTGWQPGETVTLQVLHDPTGGDDATDPSHLPWTVTADGSGNVSSTWTVTADADELGATLQLTAVGGSSGRTASWTFTDKIGLSNETISLQPTPYPTYGTPTEVDYSYDIKVTGAGNDGITGSINITGLPAGTSFSPQSVLLGNTTNQITLKITTGINSPATLSGYNFNVC